MNKFKKAILAAGIVAVISGVNVYIALANTGKVTKETVRLREAASTDSNIIMNLDYGDEVEIIGEEGEWYKVKFKGNEGYMFKEYIEAETGTVKASSTPEPTAKPTAETKTETTSNTKSTKTRIKYVGTTITLEKDTTMYLFPVLLSSKISSIPSGTELTVTKEVNNWVKVSYNGKSGWVAMPTTAAVETTNTTETTEEENEPEETATEETTTSTARKGKINVDGANVREKASGTSEVIASLGLDEEVNIIGEEDDYYKISTDSIKEGYVAKRLIDEEQVTSRGGMREDEETVEEPVQENVQEDYYDEEEEDADDDYYYEPRTYSPPSYDASSGQEVVDFALEFEGWDYVYGGTSPETGFDCTGFAYYIYNNCGIDLARTIGYQMNTGDEVDLDDAEPGDLIVFYDSGYSGAGHVGIYIGNDEFIHASNPTRGVRIDSVYNSYYYPRIITIRRIQ